MTCAEVRHPTWMQKSVRLLRGLANGLARRADSATQSQFSVHFSTKTTDFFRSEFCGVLIRSGYEVVAKGSESVHLASPVYKRARNGMLQKVSPHRKSLYNLLLEKISLPRKFLIKGVTS